MDFRILLVKEIEFSYLSLIFCFNIVLMSSFINFTLHVVLFPVEPFHSY